MHSKNNSTLCKGYNYNQNKEGVKKDSKMIYRNEVHNTYTQRVK